MFFIISKICYYLIQPFSLAMAVLLAGWLVLLKNPRAGRRLVMISFLILFLFSWGPITDFLIIPLEKRFLNMNITGPVDGVIVLGGGFRVLKSGPVQFAASSRFIQGLDLIRRHPQAKLVFSGGNSSLVGNSQCEAYYMKRTAESLGISPGRILIDCNSRNTRESAVETGKLLKDYIQKKPLAKWVLITSAFHMPRAIGCFRKAGMDPVPYNADYLRDGHYNFMSLPSVINLMNSGTAIKEWCGLLAYSLSGYTAELFPK